MGMQSLLDAAHCKPLYKIPLKERIGEQQRRHCQNRTGHPQICAGQILQHLHSPRGGSDSRICFQIIHIVLQLRQQSLQRHQLIVLYIQHAREPVIPPGHKAEQANGSQPCLEQGTHNSEENG